MLSLATLEPTQSLVDPQDKIDEWYAKRRGKFTCSRFGDLFVTGRRKDETFGKTAMMYLYQKAAERLGSYEFPFSSRSTDWGINYEAEAIECLQQQTEGAIDYDPHRFIEFDDWTGGSPDALLGTDAVIEVKCPYTPSEHLKTWHTREVPPQYHWQVFGHLYVSGRQRCLFVSYDPRLERPEHKLVCIAVERDEKKMELLKERIELAKKEVQLILG